MDRKNKKYLKVAITGNIGSGKSTFSRFLAEEGFPVIYADNLAKEILFKSSLVRNKLIRYFGNEALSGNSIDKKFLAEKIFSSRLNLRFINSILHPLVRKKIEDLSSEYFLKSNIVFVEAALIYESKIERMYDYVVLISADLKLREKRNIKAARLTEDDFRKRNNSQIKDDTKIKKADFVFHNNGTKAELREKAGLLISILKSYLV